MDPLRRILHRLPAAIVQHDGEDRQSLRGRDLIDRMRVSDPAGKVVFTADGVADYMFRLDVSGWNAGAYYLEVFLQDGQIHRHAFIR